MLPLGARPTLLTRAGFVTAPSTTLTTVTMVNGDGNRTILSYSKPQQSFIVNAWNKSQAVGVAQLIFPRGGDQNNGYSWNTLIGAPFTQWPYGHAQEVFSQDLLTMQLSGSATAGDLELLAWDEYYTQLDGIYQNLITPQQLVKYRRNDITLRHSVTGVATGQYAQSLFSAATVNNMKPNTYYAIVGMFVDTACNVVAYQGPELGNLRIGMPGNNTNKDVTNNYFWKRSEYFGLPMIPVVNSASNGNTSVNVQCDENGGTFLINTQLVELFDNVATVLRA